MDLTSSSQTKGNGLSLVEKVKLSFLKMKREDEGYGGEPAKSGINSPEEQKCLLFSSGTKLILTSGHFILFLKF